MHSCSIFSFIVTFVQAVSNIQSLAKVLPFLTVLEELPTTVVGIIQGIFPAIALAILVALVPIIFRCKLDFALYLFVIRILTYHLYCSPFGSRRYSSKFNGGSFPSSQVLFLPSKFTLFLFHTHAS